MWVTNNSYDITGYVLVTINITVYYVYQAGYMATFLQPLGGHHKTVKLYQIEIAVETSLRYQSLGFTINCSNQ